MTLLCIQKSHMRAGPIETSISDANHAVLHPQNDRSYLGPIETSVSAPKVAVVHPKTTDKGWDP